MPRARYVPKEPRVLVPYETKWEFSEMGRSGFWMKCPFCGEWQQVYTWSLAGCGKLCEGVGCHAKLTLWGCIDRELEKKNEHKIQS